jgi:hypothetical protein
MIELKSKNPIKRLRAPESIKQAGHTPPPPEHPGFRILRELECDIERLQYEQAANDITLILLKRSREELLNMSDSNVWPDFKAPPKKEATEEISDLDERLKNLEAVYRKATKELGKTKMIKRFSSIRELFEFIRKTSKEAKNNPKEMERLANLEVGRTEVLNKLEKIGHTRKFILLQEIQRDFKQTMEGKA